MDMPTNASSPSDAQIDVQLGAQIDVQAQILRQIGRRRDSRLRLNIPARLETIRGNFNGLLIDLSQSGCHILTEEKLTCGHDVVLVWLKYEAFGRVVWSAQCQAGLEFEELLPPQTLISTRDHTERDTRKEDKRDAFLAARAWYNEQR